MTREAMRFIEEAWASKPWCLHLSYVKPHWPYMAPAPYHACTAPEDCLPAIRSRERSAPTQHPVLAAYRQHEDESRSFSRDEARATCGRPTWA